MRGILAAVLAVVLAIAGVGAYFYLKKSPEAVVVAALDEARIARLEALADKTPASARADETQLRALADALAGFASVEIGAIESEADGAVARDVVVRFGEEKAAGLSIGELRAWGAGDASRIADRLDMRGVSSFGLEALVEKQTKAYTDLFTESLGGLGQEGEAKVDFAAQIGSYEVGADRFIVDELVIHPEEAAASDIGAPFMAMLAGAAAANRRVSLDASATYGFRFSMTMDQAAAASEISGAAPFLGVEGWRRGDNDFTVVRDLSFTADTSMPETQVADEETGELYTTPAMNMAMGGGYGLMTIEGVKVARLYEHLAKGALPPTTETDVMSLGVWRARDQTQTFGGRELASVKESFVDLRNFHWLVPTEIRTTATGGKYNMAALFDYVQESAAGAGGDSAELAQFEQLTAMLKEIGLDAIAYDGDMAVTWSPNDGATSSQINLSADNIGEWLQSADGALPDFAAVEQWIPTEGETFDGEAVMPEVVKALALHRASLVLTDKGGIDKGFALAVAMAKLAPEDDASAAMLRNADPADLRVSSAAMIRLSAQQAAAAFPPAVGYMNAVADFLQKGGALRIEANPPAPFTAALLESEAEAMQSDPSLIATLLGLTVVQEPADKGGK
ncbi:MAG: hypothetical protein R3C58_05250 [Parvularculaceae bacterium]